MAESSSSQAASPVAAALAGAGSCQGPGDFGAVYLGSVWPGGFVGVPVYSNGISGSFTDCLHSTRTPSGHTVVDGYEWQCVELVDRLYLTKGWINSYWPGNGDQMYQNAPPYLSKQPQGSISSVHPGDVVSFNPPGGGAGHAAVIARVQGNYLTIANQDTDAASVLSNAYLNNGTISMVGWPGWSVIGVVHAPASAAAKPAPPLRVTTTRLPAAHVNSGYAVSVRATGGSGKDRWSLASGSLPGGLSLSPSGRIAGNPVSSGNWRVVVQVRDSAGKRVVTTLSLGVQAGANLLSDASFQSRGLGPWRILGSRSSGPIGADVRHGLRDLPAGDSELQIATNSGGSVYQDVSESLFTGASYAFAVSLRSASRTPVQACVVLWGMPKPYNDSTCRSVRGTWQRVVAPYDVTRGGQSELRAQVYVFSRHAHLDVTGGELVGNALQHASFQNQQTGGWTKLPAGRRDSVSASAVRTPGLPEGGDELQASTTAPGGSVYQDVTARIASGQSFLFSTYVRASARAQRAAVCAVLWGLPHGAGGREQRVAQCAIVGTSWSLLSVPLEVRGGAIGMLRAQVYVLSARRRIDLDAAVLSNSGLHNASFEAGSAAWQLQPGPHDHMSARIGSSSSVPGGGRYLAFGSSRGNGSVDQRVPVTSASPATYAFSAWVRADPEAKGSLTVCVTLRAVGGNLLFVRTCDRVGHAWTLLSAPLNGAGWMRGVEARLQAVTPSEMADVAGTTLALPR